MLYSWLSFFPLPLPFFLFFLSCFVLPGSSALICGLAEVSGMLFCLRLDVRLSARVGCPPVGSELSPDCRLGIVARLSVWSSFPPVGLFRLPACHVG